MEINKVYQGDCMELLKQLPDSSVDCVITDPPYYKIKKDEWDNQWKTFEDYLDWIEAIILECKRVLKSNGSLYIFADDERVAYIQVRLDKHLTFLNHLVWYKPNNLPLKYAHNHKKFAPMSERILFYSVQKSKTGLQETFEDKNCYKKIKEYMRDERRKIIKHKGFKTLEEFNQYINEVSDTSSVVSRHYFPDSQWVFPTKEIYEKLQTTGFFKIPYEELRQEYEELRQEYEEMRRTYNFQKGIHEIISEPTIQKKENSIHSTTKPVRLIRKLVLASTNKGDIVLDPFMGSGTTAIACESLNRRWVGFEINSEYVALINNKRMNQKYLHHFDVTQNPLGFGIPIIKRNSEKTLVEIR